MKNSPDLNQPTNSKFFNNTLSKISDRFLFLHRIVLFHFFLLLICLIGILVDDRQILGINVWIKPAKFIISSIIVLWTIGWYLLVYPFREKTKTFIASFSTVLMLIDIIVIFIQAARGVKSHFNMETPLDGLLFGIMGISISLFTFIVFWLLIKSFSPRLEFPNSMKWSFRMGWFCFLFSSAIGSQMIGQMSHSIGVVDGESGLPFLNWSTLAGDLRVAHFFGLHAIQILPLTIFYFSQKIKNNTITTFASIIFALLYLGLIAFTFYQAKQGQPFLSL